MSLIMLFIILQSILLLFMLLHDLIKVPPFNDIDALRATDSTSWLIFSTIVNSFCVAIPLYLTLQLFFQSAFSCARLIIVCFYALLTFGTICSWWMPYILGSSASHKMHFHKFKNTHHFLPARGNNVVPNSLHVVLHLLVWSCCALSIYFYFMV